MKNILFVVLALSMTVFAYADPVEPEVVVNLQLTKDEVPPTSTSIKWTFDDMGNGPSISFSISLDESSLSLGDFGYKRILSTNPASSSSISIIQLTDKSSKIEGYYDSGEIFINNLEGRFSRYDVVTSQLLETYNFPYSTIPDSCLHIYTALNPKFYFECDNNVYFSYDAVTHAVAEITKDDIYPQVTENKEKYVLIKIDPETTIKINLYYKTRSQFYGLDASNNIYYGANVKGKRLMTKWNTEGNLVGKFEMATDDIRQENCISIQGMGTHCDFPVYLETLDIKVGGLGSIYAVQRYDNDKLRIVRWPASVFQPITHN